MPRPWFAAIVAAMASMPPVRGHPARGAEAIGGATRGTRPADPAAEDPAVRGQAVDDDDGVLVIIPAQLVQDLRSGGRADDDTGVLVVILELELLVYDRGGGRPADARGWDNYGLTLAQVRAIYCASTTPKVLLEGMAGSSSAAIVARFPPSAGRVDANIGQFLPTAYRLLPPAYSGVLGGGIASLLRPQDPRVW